MIGKVAPVLAAFLILSMLAMCFGTGHAEDNIPQPQIRSDAPWMRQMLKNPEVRHLLAEYVLYTPSESKRAIIDSLGGDYLIKKRRMFDPYS